MTDENPEVPNYEEAAHTSGLDGQEPLLLPPEIDPRLAAVLLFTKPQMAAMLQISIRTLNSLMRQGDVSYLRIKGKLVRFRVEDVMRRLNQVALVNPANTEKEDA